MTTYKVDISLSRYKGKVFEGGPVVISCSLQKLIGDCSGWSVGATSVCNGYALSDEDKGIMQKILVHKIVNNMHFHYGTVKKDWCNKYIFSGPTDSFIEDGNHFSSLYNTFLGLTEHKEQAIMTRGWHGSDYEVKVITVPKSYKHHIPLEGIVWEGMDVSVKMYADNKIMNNPHSKTLRTIDAEIKRHQW